MLFDRSGSFEGGTLRGYWIFPEDPQICTPTTPWRSTPDLLDKLNTPSIQSTPKILWGGVLWQVSSVLVAASAAATQPATVSHRLN